MDLKCLPIWFWKNPMCSQNDEHILSTLNLWHKVLLLRLTCVYMNLSITQYDDHQYMMTTYLTVRGNHPLLLCPSHSLYPSPTASSISTLEILISSSVFNDITHFHASIRLLFWSLEHSRCLCLHQTLLLCLLLYRHIHLYSCLRHSLSLYIDMWLSDWCWLSVSVYIFVCQSVSDYLSVSVSESVSDALVVVVSVSVSDWFWSLSCLFHPFNTSVPKLSSYSETSLLKRLADAVWLSHKSIIDKNMSCYETRHMWAVS